MASLRNREGYVLVDNRASPGVSDDTVRKFDLPPGVNRGLFEAPTYTCSHCQRVVVINPDRSRQREYCRKCDHYICDGCGAKMAVTKECKTFNQIADEIMEAGAKGITPDLKIIIP